MSDNAVTVTNVSKDFRIPQEKAGSIKAVFTGMLKQKRRKNLGLQHALKGVSFEVKKGEFFGIVGRNGSGKSTLLKMLAGIYQPSKGSVQVEGKLVPFIELGVGFNPELTGRQNVYLNGALLGFSEKEVAQQYDDIVEFAELKDFMDQKLKNYSSGMQVRLAFSMAVRANADILLIDEVLAVGDADFQRKCFEYFNQLKKAKKTVIFVSHNMDAVIQYCDRAMLIEKNEVVQIGKTIEIAEKYLRLFSKQASGDVQYSQDDIRWGDGSMKIESVHVTATKDWVTINQTFKALREVEGPTVGIRIRSSSGQAITGTSSQLEHVSLDDMKKGQRMNAQWRFPNVLSDGKYFVDPAVAHAEGAVIADWWDEAAEFTVQKNRHLPYPIDPTIELTIKAAA